MINDYRGSTTVLDYKEFRPKEGLVVKDLQVWSCSGEVGRTQPTDSIAVFFNFDKVVDVKSKDLAWDKVQELLKDVPAFALEEAAIFRKAIFGYLT